jgi:hypothetical protein
VLIPHRFGLIGALRGYLGQTWRTSLEVYRQTRSSREDLNGHVGATNIGFEGVHGGFGYDDKNQEGKDILDFAVA